jgi:mono/diheme cytochrome c family protein
MTYLKYIVFLLPVACSINSIHPSGGGLEMNMDLDLSSANMRHGWAYFSSPQQKKDEVISIDRDAVARGEQLYLQHCEKCHGPKGEGNGKLAEAIKIQPKNLQNVGENLSQTYLVVQINEGKGSMPMWKDFLTPRQTVDLTHYIRSLARSKSKDKKK